MSSTDSSTLPSPPGPSNPSQGPRNPGASSSSSPISSTFVFGFDSPTPSVPLSSTAAAHNQSSGHHHAASGHPRSASTPHHGTVEPPLASTVLDESQRPKPTATTPTPKLAQPASSARGRSATISSPQSTPSKHLQRPTSSSGLAFSNPSSPEKKRTTTWLESIRAEDGTLLDRGSTPLPVPQPTFHGSGSHSSSSATLLPDNSSKLTLTISSHSQLAVPSSPEAGNRRRLFGRSNSIREIGRGLPGETSKESKGLLRRMGSKNFFGNFNKEAMKSTDTVGSLGQGEDSASVKGGDSSSSTKLGSLPSWARRRGKSGPKGEYEGGRQSPTVSEVGTCQGLPSGRDSIDSCASSASTSEVASNPNRSPKRISNMALGNSGGLGAPAPPLSAPNGEGIPKRLSGWIFGMLGNEGQPAPDTSEIKPTSASEHPSSSSREGSTDFGPPANRNGQSQASTVSAGTASSTRSKTGNLLYSLTGGRAKASNTANQSGTGAGAGIGGVGLDKALKYFLDSESLANQGDEGIWLLGVWHGPCSDDKDMVVKETSATDRGISHALPDPLVDRAPGGQHNARSETITSATVRKLAQCHSKGERQDGEGRSTDDVERKHDASSPPRSPRTPSPISATSLSLPSSDRQSQEPEIVARNPPTPQSSPHVSRTFQRSTQPGKLVAAPDLTKNAAASQTMSTTSSSASTQSSAARSNHSLDWQATSFHPDFSSRIWCTYRNHFAPIARDGSISDQAAGAAAAAALALAQKGPSSQIPEKASTQANTAAGRTWLGRRLGETTSTGDGFSSSPSQSSAAGGSNTAYSGGVAGMVSASAPASSPPVSAVGGFGEKMGIPNLWGRATAAAQAAGFSRSGLTTDAGWGCMLRTGQSLLANALLDIHLGRSWRSCGPPIPIMNVDRSDSGVSSSSAQSSSIADWKRRRKQYVTYVKLLSWFLDDPSPSCPFSVHRMAREGKRLGKEVGEWFGPSTAAGAIKQLVAECPEAGIGVTVASDGVFYLDEVRSAAAAVDQGVGPSAKGRSCHTWQRPVLILIGIRLGLDGVHPMYYDSVKETFSFPQSMGIAGGRPSSSYYFMGFQGSSLFYLDPHHVRPAVPFKHPPPQFAPASTMSQTRDNTDIASVASLQDDEEEWWINAYSESQLATFHCDRVRRMPIKSLDPSMLLGFLVKDEHSLEDLCVRIKTLPKTIFSFADSPPRWAEDDDFDPSMESVSESSVDGDAQENDSDTDDEGDEDAARSGCERSEGIQFPGDDDTSSVGREPNSAHKMARDRRLGAIHHPSTLQAANGQKLTPLNRAAEHRPAHDLRQFSASSGRTARSPSMARETSLDPATAATPSSSATLPPSPSTNGNLGDESFSSAAFSDSEAGSAWEEVSEGGTVAGWTNGATAPITGQGGSSAERDDWSNVPPLTSSPHHVDPDHEQQQFTMVEGRSVALPSGPDSNKSSSSFESRSYSPDFVEVPPNRAEDRLLQPSAQCIVPNPPNAEAEHLNRIDTQSKPHPFIAPPSHQDAPTDDPKIEAQSPVPRVLKAVVSGIGGSHPSLPLTASQELAAIRNPRFEDSDDDF
ncbi:hypothetical protein IE53DRAFT_182586 [Violaceomyces palustris]|uniref:Uncharacterized protein n=1 Tax=Violaceomyces palustris TaxID=1673888 RepID=A0ACD0NSB4_9BASI|nr:hypothetical protein IE53DRAFT_182586 [Violaceomyces palustris]